MLGAFLVQMFLILGFINSRTSNVFPTVSVAFNKRQISVSECVYCVWLFKLVWEYRQERALTGHLE